MKRLPEALWRSQFFFLLPVWITFPRKRDVWGKLCPHFAAVKVMTFDLSLQILHLSKNKKINPFFLFLKKSREGSRKDLVLLEASGLCAESVGVGCQRAPIARIRYRVWTSHQVYRADLHDNTWKQE